MRCTGREVQARVLGDDCGETEREETGRVDGCRALWLLWRERGGERVREAWLVELPWQ